MGKCVVARGQLPRVLFLFLIQNMQERSSLLGKVVHQIKFQRRKDLVMRVYMSTAVRDNNVHIVLYRYCCEGRYSV